MNCQKLLRCPFSHSKFKSHEAANRFIKDNFDEVYKHIIAGFQTPLNVYAYNKPFFRDMMKDHETKILETGHRDNTRDSNGRQRAMTHKIKYTELNIGDSYEGIIGGNVLGGSISNSDAESEDKIDPNNVHKRSPNDQDLGI